MKKPRQALSNKNTPRRIPLGFAAFVWLLLDHINPPQWVWGVALTILTLAMLGYVVDFFSAEDVELEQLTKQDKPL